MHRKIHERALGLAMITALLGLKLSAWGASVPGGVSAGDGAAADANKPASVFRETASA